MVHDTKIHETPPKWFEEWIPFYDHVLESDLDNEGDEDPDGHQFNQTYLTWWVEERPNPLGLYGVERFVKATQGEVEEAK